MSAPTNAGRHKYLLDKAFVLICKVSHIYTLVSAFVLEEKKIHDLAKLTISLELVQ
jgi:hypothetical protein